MSLEDLQAIAAVRGFSMKPADAQDYLTIIQTIEKRINHANELPEYFDPRLATLTETSAPRNYTIPSKKENPLNGWSHKVSLVVQLTLR